MEGVSAAAAFTIVPRHVLGRGYRAPSDTLNFACIGVGGMGWSDVRGVGRDHNVYALCDVDTNSARRAFAGFPQAKRYADFREMLATEADNIDAVTVSTPDHVHASATMAALRLKKHVYCQKPLTRTVHEARTVADEARRAGVVTQMGNQGHASDGVRVMREWVEAGLIGTVREVQYWTNRPIWPQAIRRPTEVHHVPPHLQWDLWLGPSPERPYHPAYAPFRWRGWWDFGTGALGDIACHAMDAAFWVLDLGYPERVEPDATQLFPETAPTSSRVEYTFPRKGDRAPVKVVWRDGGLVPAAPPEIDDVRGWPPSAEGGQLWIGDEGKLLADIYGRNPRLLDAERHAEVTANPLPERYPRVEGVYGEWIDAIMAGTRSGSDFAEYAGPLTEMVLLSNLAVRMGRTLEFDTSSGDVTNVAVPEDFVRPSYRDGWTL
jgi:predicted dehydrogenase